MRLTPDKDQEKVLRSLVRNQTGGALIAGQMGTGKTLISVEYALRTGAERVLVAAPLSTFGFARDGKYDGWIGTFTRQGWKHKIVVVKTREDVTDGPGLFIIGREFLSSITRDTTKQVGLSWLKQQPFDLFIYDECHALSQRKVKTPNGNLTMTGAAFSVPSKDRLALSATPFRTKFDNIWTVCRFLWRNDFPDLIPKSYWSWRYKWCDIEHKRFGARQVETVTGEKNPGEFVSKLPEYHRMTAPTKVVNKQVYVTLPPKQRKAYSEMEKVGVAWLKEHDAPIVAALPIVQRIRLREMTLGLPEMDLENNTIKFDLACDSAKLDWLVSFLKDFDGQLLVYTHSQKFAEVVAHRVNGALWTGKQTPKDRAAAKAAFLAGEHQVMVATPRSFGTGTDGLQHVCDTMVFLSRDDSDTDNLQGIGRLDRQGQKSSVVSVIDVIAPDTYDEGDLSKEARAVLGMTNSLATA